MRFFLIILSISVLIFKITELGQLNEQGALGMNEQALVGTITTSFIDKPLKSVGIEFNSLEKIQNVAKLESQGFVQYEDKSFSEIKYNDKEAYKGSIDLATNTLYYMSIIFVPAFLFYIFVKSIPSIIRKIRFPKKDKDRKRDKLDVVLSILSTLLFIEVGIKFFLV